MKKFVLGIAATTCLVITGCGTSPAVQRPSANNRLTTGQQQNTTTNSSNSPSNNATSTGPVSVVDLQPFTGFQGQGITVSIPKGWNPSTTTGGDYKAITFSNPANPQEQVRVLYSTCVGCYMNANGKPDPAQVISEKNASNVQVSGAGGLIANYDFNVAGSSYQGTGRVQVSTNQSGYTEIDVLVSQQNQALRDAIMNSFNYAS
ncbi:hypothetical protein [Alicyclobacillus mengziensis]|uniref:Lipoprotein n=1 Tax=Alicyclobacillus mengziensis TaxID=2931921 RepID=A0A9X7Z5F9_9BACL|nr:hypothetical protein [Alicyclobacillus mengziensis]QSO46292.1 hypothetical protein JZ786_17565 [Alicyclobacillus mengziensis]